MTHALPETPDFDAYPTGRRVAGAAADGRGVNVTWDDGLESRYHVFWLRENAPEADVTNPDSREQHLQLVDIPDDLTALSARAGQAGELCVRWSTGQTSRYHPGWLRAYTHGAPEDQYALPPRETWDAGLASSLPRFDGAGVLADADGERDRWAEALHVYGVALVEGLPADPEMIFSVPSFLGPVRPTNFGPAFDVRSKAGADVTSNAYTAMALPVHTDLCTREYKPGLQFLYCLENSADGGESELADGFRIAEAVRDRAPAAFDALITIPVSYYSKATGSDYRWEKPMFALDGAGAIDEIRWSPWLRAPSRLPFSDVDRLYEGLRAAFRIGDEPGFKVQIKLRPGDMLCFDNRRVLHGRLGYDPASGSRWLRGCYVEREELHSRLRIMARRRRAVA